MVLIEGPDASGKSTLIKELKKKGYPVSKPYYPSKDQFKYYLLSGPIYQDAWLERYFPSEFVYSVIKKDRKVMKNHERFMIEASVAPFNPVIIYCRPPEKEILKNIKKRGDDYINEKEIKEVIREYDKFMDESLLNIVTYDYTKHNLRDLLDRVELIKESPPKYKLNPLGLIAGNRTRYRNLMFVGDEPSQTSIGNGFIRPFISDKGSSLLLHECLYESGLYEQNMPYFTNFYKFTSHEVKAKKSNGEKLVHEILFMAPRKIICLGNESYKNTSGAIENSILRDHNPPEIIKLDHPSYIKRFGGKKEYIEKIRKIIV